jgi:hypothetical protein
LGWIVLTVRDNRVLLDLPRHGPDGLFTLRAQALRHFPARGRYFVPIDPGLRQIAQDLRGLFYDGTKPFESLARLLAELVDDPDFGNLRIGLLADCLAPPEDAGAVVAAGVERLVAAGVDLILATFSHAAWVLQSRRTGFVLAPTTTRLFVSPALSVTLPLLQSFHLTRGDCDGPLPYDKVVEAPEGTV